MSDWLPTVYEKGWAVAAAAQHQLLFGCPTETWIDREAQEVRASCMAGDDCPAKKDIPSFYTVPEGE